MTVTNRCQSNGQTQNVSKKTWQVSKDENPAKCFRYYVNDLGH